MWSFGAGLCCSRWLGAASLPVVTLLLFAPAALGQDSGYELLFESQLDEFSSRCVEPSNPIPSWAQGDFIIPSTGQFEMGDRHFVGMLDAFGKLHRFVLGEGKVCATYRLMASKFYNNSKAKNTITADMLFFETEPPRHCPLLNPICNMLGPNDNNYVNTIKHDGKLLAMTDDPHFLQIDPVTMQVLGPIKFTDSLEKVAYTGSAHPLRHPGTGNWVDFVGNAGLLSGATVVVFELGNDDPFNRKSFASVPMESPPFMHSFGVTQKHVVLPHMPVHFDFKSVMFEPLHAAFKDVNITPATASENGFRVVPLAGGPARTLTLPEDLRLYYTHTINAFENSSGIVIDLCTFPSNPFAGNLTVTNSRDKSSRDKGVRSVVRRFLLPHADGTAITSEVVSDVNAATDFTKVNPRVAGQKHCFYWGVQWFTDTRTYGSMSIVKYDLCNQTPKREWHRPNWFPSEATFIPAPSADAAEDDGVLLFTALDGQKGQTSLMVVNAATMETISEVGPFPRIGFTTHGEFYPKDNAPYNSVVV